MNGRTLRHIDSISGVSHVRGIGKDNHSNIYVTDSQNRRLLKFNKNLKPLRLHRDEENLLSELFGVLVTDEYVFTCSPRDEKILIFNHDLNLLYEASLSHDISSCPADLTKLDGRYFVTCTNRVILVMTIDFHDGSYQIKRFKSFIKNGEESHFEHELRGICTSDGYLYIAEPKNSLLCLQYDTESCQLKYVDQIPSCCPIALTSHKGKVYFSRKIKADYAIAEVTRSAKKISFIDFCIV